MGKVHVFPYSPRPGTPAAAMPGRPAPQELRDRSRRLRDLSDRLGFARRRGVGRRDEVLVEKRHEDGTLSGLGRGLQPVRAPGGIRWAGGDGAGRGRGRRRRAPRGAARVTDCLFCRIVAGEIPATIVSRGDGFLAFEDIAPKAPVHLLVIPERHVDSIADVASLDDQERAAMMSFIAARPATPASTARATGSPRTTGRTPGRASPTSTGTSWAGPAIRHDVSPPGRPARAG